MWILDWLMFLVLVGVFLILLLVVVGGLLALLGVGVAMVRSIWKDLKEGNW